MVGSRVYVGGLPYGTRERDLEKFFKGYGRTRDILIKNGYGFVEFEDYRDADDAVYELNGKELLGERVVVEPARGTARGGGGHRDRYSDDRYGRRGGGGRYERNNSSSRNNNSRYGPPLRTEYRLIVENLSSRVSWQDLKDYMRQAGEVTYADAHKQNRNEGVVEFATLKDMKTAIEKLDDTELNGRRIRLVEDTRRNGRSRRSRSSSSRSRSNSRRRSSRSRSRRSSRRGRDSRSKSRGGGGGGSRSKSPAEKKSRSRSHYSEKSRSRSRDSGRSGSKASNRDRNRDRSASNASDKAKSRSRDRSRSEDKNDKSRSRSRSGRSGSAHSADRNNESMDD